MQSKTKKPILLLALAAASGFGAGAQSLDEGIKMVKYERYTSAEKILQPLAAGNATANYYYGLTQLGEENKTAAAATFAKFPDDPANMAGMARLAFMNNNPTEGTRLATAVADKAKKKDWQPLVYAADAINYGGGNAQDAVRYYEEALKRGGDNIDVRIGLGDAYQNIQGGGGKAMDNYENATRKDTKNSLGYSRIGSLWYSARTFDSALNNLNRAKDIDPANPLPYKALADAYYRVGRYEPAKQNIEKYYDLSDKTCSDRISYGNILYQAKYYPDAIAKMQEVISTCGEQPYMYKILGKSQYETKDYPGALQNMQTYFTKQTDPGRITPDDYKYIGLIYSAQKQADSADVYLTKAVAADTSSNKKKLYTDIGDSYKSMGGTNNYAKAGQYYKLAADAAGKDAAALDYFNYGVYNYYGKNYSDAAQAFEQMETKFPDQPSATYWRARVAAAVDSEGKTGAAVPMFNKWLAIPETPTYKRKPADLNVAYQYNAIVAYNKEDKAAVKDYIEKIRVTDPTNALATQLEGIINKPKASGGTTAPKPAGGAKPAAGTKPKK